MYINMFPYIIHGEYIYLLGFDLNIEEVTRQ